MTKPINQHYVVAIGASAGGLEAIQEFFDNMPNAEQLSFVIIQHLSPDFRSLLVELVARHTHMKVVEAEHQQLVQKQHIYVIPNNKQIRIEHSRLILSEKTHEKGPNNAIDVFLHSLAVDKRQRAIAVVLSGTGTDGTRGIATIKEYGGLAFAQEPKSARFDGMPNSAISSGCIDVIAPPSELGSAIIEALNNTNSSKMLPEEPDEKELATIFKIIANAEGQHFHYYKTPTILRRVSKRMQQLQIREPAKYIDYLAAHPEESKALAHDFLISVTRFFRDKDAFSILETKVLPEILAEKETDEQLKVWVAACSTGEEAYSVAILIDRVLERQNKTLDVKIFASDIDAANLELAFSGVYPQTIVNDVPKDILQNYFTQKGKYYTVIPRIRKQIVFARHDITRDPPFIKNDLITCRNMLIYMNPVLQEKVYSMLQFAVNKGGYLFLGPSENPTSAKGVLHTISSKWKIYRKEVDIRPRINISENLSSNLKAAKEDNSYSKKYSESKHQRALWTDIRQSLLQDQGLIGLYIDRNFEVKETIGNYERVLTLPRKILNLNLSRMLPPGAGMAISKAIRHAWKTNKTELLHNIVLEKEDTTYLLQIAIHPVVGESDLTLVTILPTPAPASLQVVTHSEGAADPDYVSNLENELNEVRNNLQEAVEDLETLNEELQSSNEELLSSNEELQSSNEELQSLNEELYTLNTEHQLKIKELVELNDDLNNYFRSTDIAQIFLDSDFNIRKFNPASARMINFIESDLGRPIAHISNNIKYDKLMEDINHVQRTRKTVEKEVQLLEGKNMLMRILPYLTRDNKYAGIIITFVDITVVTHLNNIIRSVFNASQSAILALQSITNESGQIADFKISTLNRTALDWFSKDKKPLEGQQLKEVLPELLKDELLQEYQQVIAEDRVLQRDLYMVEKKAWYEISGVKMPGGLVITFTDITDKKRSLQKIRQNYAELNEVKEHLRELNAELENKVRERTRELAFSEERFRLVAKATNDALWDWNLTDDQIWWSESFNKLFGHSTDNMTRRKCIDLVHPDDKQLLTASIYGAINEGRNQWSQEYRMRKENGEYAHVLDRGYILHNEFGVPYRMLGSMMDLTALKEAESAVATNIAEKEFLAESMPLTVWTAIEPGKLDFVNTQFEHYTNMSFEEAVGEGWKRAVHKADLPLLMEIWKSAALEKHDFTCEIRLATSSPTYRWNLLRAKARKDDEDNVSGWVITIMDMHEQKVMNEILEEKVAERTHQLQEINERLEASNNDLQLFASVASHDLQEPLRKIHMFSKLVRDRHKDDLPDTTVVYLNKIMQSVNRMKSLMLNILNFSKLTANRGGTECVNLKDIIEEVKEDFEMLISEKNAHIIVGEMPALMVNRSQMQQVFQNLIGNSLKFTHKDNDPVINITATRITEKSFDAPSSPDGRWYKISVSDNGIGFEQQFKNKIFDLFLRLNSKDQYEGTGIGLAIIKKIVENHQGLITAESTMGKGATFHIILPTEQE
ncbi:two-component system, chemotaxis family, CheB/CheR fusion protein [Chitinophaga terrae (ex Kim and Jung 2007)]|uniref:histidine kinase n=1 Tax=Chitinophaga terrae (ex Kim and Jung 2007) TaxID=408074 RepID=A0A1H3X4E9_9BACT|nr:chemotaxis protein CheB [Chitinophaga terrae (ex Kim and Jung 2007)]GEP89918.1 protein-glutamate methylesterase [Chitinophaga terrae (ex Kim and Jung 2007)]SDZ94279.1 two-component system, chemotaxis family, CheB/CheR fusion protein [Chitinophaga terrae (ex Kim and Jung 2007)]